MSILWRSGPAGPKLESRYWTLWSSGAESISGVDLRKCWSVSPDLSVKVEVRKRVDFNVPLDLYIKSKGSVLKLAFNQVRRMTVRTQRHRSQGGRVVEITIGYHVHVDEVVDLRRGRLS